MWKYVDAFAHREQLLSLTNGKTGFDWLLDSATSNILGFFCPDLCNFYPGTSNKRRYFLDLVFKLEQVRKEYRGRENSCHQLEIKYIIFHLQLEKQ